MKFMETILVKAIIKSLDLSIPKLGITLVASGKGSPYYIFSLPTGHRGTCYREEDLKKICPMAISLAKKVSKELEGLPGSLTPYKVITLTHP
jgi:hypothetical protein